jgi:hypothetical protein
MTADTTDLNLISSLPPKKVEGRACDTKEIIEKAAAAEIKSVENYEKILDLIPSCDAHTKEVFQIIEQDEKSKHLIQSIVQKTLAENISKNSGEQEVNPALINQVLGAIKADTNPVKVFYQLLRLNNKPREKIERNIESIDLIDLDSKIDSTIDKLESTKIILNGLEAKCLSLIEEIGIDNIKELDEYQSLDDYRKNRIGQDLSEQTITSGLSSLIHQASLARSIKFIGDIRSVDNLIDKKTPAEVLQFSSEPLRKLNTALYMFDSNSLEQQKSLKELAKIVDDNPEIFKKTYSEISSNNEGDLNKIVLNLKQKLELAKVIKEAKEKLYN